jgi:fluoride exporter
MDKLLLVGSGGFIGSVVRYLASGFIQKISKSFDFPYGTLFVNIVGCFLIGALSELADTRGVFTQETRALIFVGFLGGFTTFSTFGNESLNLFRDGNNFLALLNIGFHIFLGIGAAWLGRTIVHLIWR